MKYLVAIITLILILTGTSLTSLAEDKQMVEVDKEVIYKEVPAYKGSLKRLIDEAQKNLKEVSKKLKTQENAEAVREYIEKGNSLYADGKLKEAKEQWDKGLKLTKDPEMQRYIKENEKRAIKEQREAQKAQKKAELERKKAERKAAIEARKKQKELEKQQLAKKRLLAKKQREAEKAQKKAELEKKKSVIKAESKKKR